jgi:methyl-accepting chemotaxis protein/hemerythrin
MKKYGYPDYEEHSLEHQKLLVQVQEFKSDYDAGIKTMTVEVMGFLVDWLIDHIAQSDRKYAPFLKSKGVT